MIKDIIKMIMKEEFKANNATREYIEKSYRLLNDAIKGKFKYVDPEEKEDETNIRELHQTGEGGVRKVANDRLIESEAKSGRKRVVD